MTTAKFPGSTVVWKDKIDFEDEVQASDINQAYAEIIAIENNIGSIYNNEAERISNENTRIANENTRISEINDIKTAYDDATKANLSIEVSNSRHDNTINIDYPTLGNRLDFVSSKMSYDKNILSLDANTWGYKGICVRNWITNGFTTQYYKDRINECITKLGIDSVQIIPNIYQQTYTATNIGYRSPVGVEETRHIIEYCKGLGLKVALCPHVESDDGRWRAEYDPSDKATWFLNYQTEIVKWATLAEETKCEIFFVGSEYKSLTVSTYRTNWETVIGAIRVAYKGVLSYGANCSQLPIDEYSTLCFWDLVDVIGLDMYIYPVSKINGDRTIPNEDYDKLMHNNTDSQNLIQPLDVFARKYNKPVIFAEYGIDAVDDSETTNINLPYQANHIEAYLKNYGNLNWNRGMFLWTIDPEGINNFYPIGRPAETIIKKYYSQQTKADKVSYPDVYCTGYGLDSNIYWTKIASVKLIGTTVVEGCISIAREQATITDKTLTDLYFRITDNSTNLSLSQNAFIHSSNITYVVNSATTNNLVHKTVDIYIKIAQYVQYSYSLKSISKNKLITLYDRQELLSDLPTGTTGNPTGNFLLAGTITGTTGTYYNADGTSGSNTAGIISHEFYLRFPTAISTNKINVSYVGATLVSLTNGNIYDVNLNAIVTGDYSVKISGRHLVDTTNRDYQIKWLVTGY